MTLENSPSGDKGPLGKAPLRAEDAERFSASLAEFREELRSTPGLNLSTVEGQVRKQLIELRATELAARMQSPEYVKDILGIGNSALNQMLSKEALEDIHTISEPKELTDEQVDALYAEGASLTPDSSEEDVLALLSTYLTQDSTYAEIFSRKYAEDEFLPRDVIQKRRRESLEETFSLQNVPQGIKDGLLGLSEPDGPPPVDRYKDYLDLVVAKVVSRVESEKLPVQEVVTLELVREVQRSILSRDEYIELRLAEVENFSDAIEKFRKLGLYAGEAGKKGEALAEGLASGGTGEKTEERLISDIVADAQKIYGETVTKTA